MLVAFSFRSLEFLLLFLFVVVVVICSSNSVVVVGSVCVRESGL